MHSSNQRLRTSGASVLVVLALSAHALAQSGSHEQGLIGDVAPGAIWPFPASSPENPYPMDTASSADVALRDAKIQLGKVLFWEEQASIDDTMACGTCHIPEAGGADARGSFPNAAGDRGSLGVLHQYLNATTGRIEYGSSTVLPAPVDPQITARTAPSMVGAYVFERMFWSGGVGPEFDTGAGSTWSEFATAESVSVLAPVNGVEMAHEAMTWSDGTLQAKLGAAEPMALIPTPPAGSDFEAAKALGVTYATWFDSVFASDTNPELANASGVTRARFAAALAHYLRSLVPDRAPIDEAALTQSFQTTYDELFVPKCASCHSAAPGDMSLGAMGGFSNAWNAPLSAGTFNFVGDDVVRVPSLRNVGLRPYFFHDGRAASLLDAVEDENDRLQLDLSPQEVSDLVAFLDGALTDSRLAGAGAPFDRPELASERLPYEANEFGVAQGSMSSPEILANIPPLMPYVGAPSHFRVGVGGVLPGRWTRFQYQVGPDPIIQLTSLITANAAGMATFHQVLPTEAAPWAAGLTVTGRWTAFDPGMPFNTATSNSASWVLFMN